MSFEPQYLEVKKQYLDEKKMMEEYKNLEQITEAMKFKRITQSGYSRYNTRFKREDSAIQIPFSAANRWPDIVPYTFNIPLLPSGAYTNASEIVHSDGGVNKIFYAINAPKPLSLYNFYELVFEKNIKSIVMLTNYVDGPKNIVKADPYLPDEIGEGERSYGEYTIKLQELIESPLEGCKIRRYSIENKDTMIIKEFIHVHYSIWPDKGIISKENLSSLLRLASSFDSGPMLVHCSAGIGRTGTFLCVYIYLYFNNNGKSIFEIATFLRKNRTTMIQTFEQYKLCKEFGE